MIDRIFLAGPHGDEDFEAARKVLQENDWIVVVNTQGGIRTKLQQLLNCQAISLIDTWWTDADCWMLQQAAGWCHMVHIDPKTGTPTEMAGRR